MHKTTLLVDDDLVGRAAQILGTQGIKQTVDAALRAVLVRHAREHLLETMKASLDFDVLRHIEDYELAELACQQYPAT